MQDEGFEKRIRFGQLYAIYGGLLTEKQQKIMEACRISDSTDPRLGKVEDILKSIIDESR